MVKKKTLLTAQFEISPLSKLSVKILNPKNTIDNEVCVLYGVSAKANAELLMDALTLLQKIIKEPMSKHKPIVTQFREKYK